MAEEGVGEIARVVAVQRVAVLFDDVGENEVADVGAPADQLLHVAPVDGQQPRQEVDGVALVDVPEDLVEEADDLLEVDVVVGEAGAAHVVREHIGAHGQQNRFQIDAGNAVTRLLGGHSVQLVDHVATFRGQDAAQRFELHG